MNVGDKTMVWGRLSRLQLPGRIIALAGIAFLGWLIVSPLAFSVSGITGVTSATVAALICLFAAEAGLLVANCFRGPAAAMNGALAAMIVRMAIPLGLGVALHLIYPMLAASGMIFYLIAFYMVDLAAETAILIAAIAGPMPRGSA
jgi:hypothetical protein